MCASPSRAQHRGPTNIPQETGNMGLVWSMAVSSHPCFSRLICWFHEIHSPLFSHFSPSLFIAGFIYMSRALLVLAHQSVVAEPGAGEGISGKAGSTLTMATYCHGHLLPSTWEAGGQPSMPRGCAGTKSSSQSPSPTQISCPHPHRGQECSSHGMQLTLELAPSCPTFPAEAALAAEFC